VDPRAGPVVKAPPEGARAVKRYPMMKRK